MQIKEIYNTILNIFYNEVVLECANGGPIIGEDMPAVYFDVKMAGDHIATSDEVNPKPILVINDKNSFDESICKYVIKMLDFYYGINVSDYVEKTLTFDDKNKIHDNIKYCLVYAFINATHDDLTNPVSYLNRRVSFLEENFDFQKEINFLGYNGLLESKKEKPFLESPYSFRITIFDEEHSYALPYIMYGISDDTAYVYAIQNKFKDSNPLRKKVNRLLFKLNKDFIDEHDSDIFNASDVSMSFVASLIAFLSYLKEIGVDKIKVPINLPIRYNSHYKSNERRLMAYEKMYSKDELDIKKEEMKKNDKLFDDNTIMKLVRTFYRVSKQGDVLNINTYPFMPTSEFDLFLNHDGKFYNELCNQIYNFDGKTK